MNHTTTAPMMLEALADEGLSAQERAPYLRLALRSTEILMCATAPGGQGGHDLETSQTRGFAANEFKINAADGEGGTYVYLTGWDGPVKGVHEEVRAMAAAVNGSVRGTYGSRTAVLLAAPVVSYLRREAWQRVPGPYQETVKRLAEAAEPRPDGAGAVLMRASGDRFTELHALKGTLDFLWGAYAGSGVLTLADLAAYDVRPYMLRSARRAVHERWTAR
jgi:hypothetical protein